MVRKVKEKIKKAVDNTAYSAVERFFRTNGVDSFREKVISELADIKNNAQDMPGDTSSHEYLHNVIALEMSRLVEIKLSLRDIATALHRNQMVDISSYNESSLDWISKKASVGQSICEKDLDILLAPRQLDATDIANIDSIREKSRSLEKGSWTSLQYQDEIIDALTRAASMQGGCILEVGILRGGLTCQLAYFAKKYKRDLYLVDIEAEMIETTKAHLESQNLLNDNIHFEHGDLTEFFRRNTFLRIPPCFVVVDALHSYYAVRHDVCSILANIPNVPVIAFHDYGLRAPTVRQIANDYPWDLNLDAVDIAIHDVIGNSTDALHPIGAKNGRGDVDLTNITGYTDIGSCEGVLLFPGLLDVSAFSTAYSYCAFHASRKI